ncbi:hypothetical protein BDD12DRAFT_882266 [Trichophaea hybrida]|nr:hypothetical protein BDD12DRAFT_882266 [Trichophaea hybrida]
MSHHEPFGRSTRQYRSSAYIPLGNMGSPAHPFSPGETSYPFHPTDDERSPSVGLVSPDFNKGQRGFSDDSRMESKGQYTVSGTPAILKRTSHRRYIWCFEILSLIVSGTAILVTAALLKHFENKDIPIWATTRNGLSLNAIFSVLSTLSRSSMLIPLDDALGQLMWLAYAKKPRRLAETELYNQASRGPLGAVKLLWRRRFSLASLAAVLMILQLGLGFTQQQLISYPTKFELYDDPENLTKLSTSETYYNDYQEELVNGTATNNLTIPVVEFRVEAALFSSLNHYMQQDPAYRCDSGNCVYPVFTTLGVCSTCTNATHDEIAQSCDDTDDYCDAHYKSLTSRSWRDSKSNSDYYSTIVNQTADATTADSIVDTWTLSVNSTAWPPIYKAYTCKVMWCVRTVNASVINSTYSEIELTMTSTASLDKDGSGTAIIMHKDFNGSDMTPYRVTKNSQLAFKTLGASLTGWSRRSDSNQKLIVNSSPLFSGVAAFSTADMMVGGKHMHRHKATPVEVMADGMSHAIRNQLTIVGKKVENHTLVKVRWVWLLYPMVSWVLSAIFLVGVVWKTHNKKGEVGAWGCSSIAQLLWGVDENVRVQAGGWDWMALEKNSENIMVQLRKEGDGWRLREVDNNRGL